VRGVPSRSCQVQVTRSIPRTDERKFTYPTAMAELCSLYKWLRQTIDRLDLNINLGFILNAWTAIGVDSCLEPRQ
jgi:hypothetical protein